MDKRMRARYIAAIKRVWSWYSPGRKQAIVNAQAYIGIVYCAVCGGQFKKTETQVDHIEPTVPTKEVSDWNMFFERLEVSDDKLQVLCKPCHQEKTLAENAERRKQKRKKP